jgi:hypothetical protein
MLAMSGFGPKRTPDFHRVATTTFHGACNSGRAISTSLNPALVIAPTTSSGARVEDVLGHPHAVHSLFRNKAHGNAAPRL